jgi:transcriptional regulator with XRE-family HTH domain
VNIGLYLRELRKRSKLSQLAVATSIGVSKFLVSDWEAPRVRIFADSLEKYLAAVGATDEERVRALRLAADPDGLPTETPPDDDFHLDLDDDIPHTPHGFPESFDGEVLTDALRPASDDGIPDTAIRGFDRDVMQPLRDALPAAPVSDGGGTAPDHPVVGVCSRSSCGGDLIPILADPPSRAWLGTRCLDCELERDLPTVRTVDEIPAAVEAAALRRGGRAA